MPPVHRVVLVAEHSPHAPDVWHTGVVPPHSPSTAHARQALVPLSQTGRVPEHCALDVQPTHTPRARSHAGVAPLQREVLVAEHWPHAPEGWHAGAPAPQSPSAAHARHVNAVASQVGVVPLHSAAVRQPAQTPALVRQYGVAPVHSVALVPEHWPHAPEGWHAGVAPPHSLSPAQARHAWKVASHSGADVGQSASARHDTQLPADTRQSGRAPVQRVALPAEHSPHAPDG